jgi:hypothetical protein
METMNNEADVARLARHLVDEALQPDAIFRYLDNEAPGEMQKLCVAINQNYNELVEEQFRSDGRNAEVEASLHEVEEQLRHHIKVTLSRRVSGS